MLMNLRFVHIAGVRVKYGLAFIAILIAAGMLPSAHAQDASPQLFPPDFAQEAEDIDMGAKGSTYVPVDNWIYPALDRLYVLGYVDSAYFGLRPWTRMSIAHMLELCADRIVTDSNNDEARELYFAVLREVRPDFDRSPTLRHPHGELESTYTRLRGMNGTPLRDSFHLGQTIVNDYGRPYENGFSNSTGFSTRAEGGPFSLYLRGEVQHAPPAAGYSAALAAFLSNTLDSIPFTTNPQQDTIPKGPIAVANDLRVMEANLSYNILGHEFSFGKNDHWLGPDMGASMLWSNNAENIYDFEINRVEPLWIPFLSRFTGSFRYDFFVGSLKGHTYPNDPWVHVEKINFKPTANVEFGFSRMVIWGGKGHEPVTLHTFLQSFFSFNNVSLAVKDSAKDPGARFGTFDFSYRLPHLRHWVTLYSDSLVHDSITPVANPPRAGVHPGIYLARFPGIEHLDLRLEGASTDTPLATVQTGQYLYWEYIQRQGPTNKGFLVGDWVGRQGKGGQAWLTYHLSPREEIQFTYRNAKGSLSFIPGGTTQNDYAFLVRKRIKKELELSGSMQFENWKAQIYKTGAQGDASFTGQLTWFPRDAK